MPTVKFQIAVSATDEGGEPFEKLFLVDMDVQSESGEVLGFVLSPCSNDNGNAASQGSQLPVGQMMPQPVPPDIGMPPQDPPTIEIDVAA